jgi:hypothetical protein
MLAMLASCSASSDKPDIRAVPVARPPAIAAADPRLESDCVPKPTDVVIRLGEDSKAFAARAAGWYVDCFNKHHAYAASQRRQRRALGGGSGNGNR